MVSLCVIKRWFHFPPHLSSATTIPWGITENKKMTNFAVSNNCFVNKQRFATSLLKIIRRAGIRLIGNRAVADRVLCVCVSTRTLRMSKTLCSVRKTIQKRTDWIVKSHVKLAFTDRLTVHKIIYRDLFAQLCQTTSRTAAVWNQSLCPSDSLQEAAVRGTVWLHIA